jgi:hypothetical protein
MDQDGIVAQVPGADKLVNWFGHWPSFHDAEVINLELNRVGRSRVNLHTFATISELDNRGRYRTDKHTLVSFLLENISSMQLDGFNDQNVISMLGVNKTEDGFELVLGGCYGVEGCIWCTRLSVECEPGIPTQRIYPNSMEN